MKYAVIGAAALSFGLVGGMATPLLADQKAQNPVVIDLTKKLKKLTRRPVGNRFNSVTGRGYVQRNVQADVVQVSIGLTAKGKTLGEALKALQAVKKGLAGASDQGGVDVIKMEESGLNIRQTRLRTFVDGQRRYETAYQGRLTLLVQFKAGGSVLDQIGQLQTDKITSVQRLQYHLSDGLREKLVKEMEAEVVEKARADAASRAQRRGRTLGDVTARNIQTANIRRYGSRTRSVPLRLGGSVTFALK